MFKQSKLAAAVLAAVATSGAYAVNLAEDQTGQVLVFPYYNTNNNFVSQISLTNTTNLYKAVKIRFRESQDSNDTLDFNIYMSPQDQWTAVVRRNPNNGKANIITTDETCTYPSKALLQAGVDFIDLYDAVDAADTSEGYFEVIEMGVIADGAGPANDGGKVAEIDGGGASPLGTVVTAEGDRSIPAGLLHDADGMPADCSVVADAWAANAAAGGFTDGAMAAGIAIDASPNDPYAGGGDILNHGLVAPTGGLTGYVILLNASNGAAYVADPTIIDNYATVPQHYESDDPLNYLLPSLASGDVVTANVPAADGTVTTVTWDLFEADPGQLDDISPNPSRPSGQNPLPMAHVMAVQGLSNDFFVETGAVNGATDWVITFPMKKHGIFNSKGYTQTANVCDTNDDGVADNPAGWRECAYDDVLAGAAGPNALAAADLKGPFDGDDVEFTFTYYDREEQDFTPAAGAPGFSPVIITQPIAARLTREVNVLSFSEAGGATQSVLGTPADNVFNLALESGWDQGWLRITFDGKYQLADGAGNAPEPIDEIVLAQPASNVAAAVPGVPAIGFAAIRGNIGPAAAGETIPHTRYK